MSLVNAAPATRASRFTFTGADAPTAEGRVAVGKDRNDVHFLVHTVGRTAESITLEAVAAAIGSGKVITPEEIAVLFAASGKADALRKALDKAAPVPAK